MRVNYTDIMLDIETLGNEGKFIVTEVALVPFCIEYNKIAPIDKCFQMSISIEDQQKKGFKESHETVKWWINTNKGKYLSFYESKTPVTLFADELTYYLSELGDNIRFWATAVLDYQGISNLFDSVGAKNPIPYNKRLCARTIRNVHDMIYGECYTNTNTHNAIDDCINQIETIQIQFSELK